MFVAVVNWLTIFIGVAVGFLAQCLPILTQVLSYFCAIFVDFWLCIVTSSYVAWWLRVDGSLAYD